MRFVTYAVGDIHGRLDLLNQLLDTVADDAARRGVRAKIVFTGDYCDRGSDSNGVVERLLAGPKRPSDTFVCLLGNHDDLFVRGVTTGEGVPDWAWYLFQHTLESYCCAGDLTARNKTLLRHAKFLSGLPLMHDDGTYLFVHAGIRPGVSIKDQTAEDLTWIREGFLDYEGSLPRRVVHGHTIVGSQPIFTRNRISIDTGAFRSGILTAVILDQGEEAILQAVGAPDLGAIDREHEISESVLRGFFLPALNRVPALLRTTISPPQSS